MKPHRHDDFFLSVWLFFRGFHGVPKVYGFHPHGFWGFARIMVQCYEIKGPEPMNFHCSLFKNNLVFRLSRLLFSMKMFYRDTVDGRNPAPFDMVNIYRALYMPGGAGFLPSTVLLLPCSKSLCLDFLSETK